MIGPPCGVLGVEEMARVGSRGAISGAAVTCREVTVMWAGRGAADNCLMLPKSGRGGRGGGAVAFYQGMPVFGRD